MANNNLDILAASIRPINGGDYYKVSFYLMKDGRPLKFNNVLELQNYGIINRKVKFSKGAGDRAIHWIDAAPGFEIEALEKMVYNKITE